LIVALWRHLQELVNQGYLKEFIINPGQPSETKVQKDHILWSLEEAMVHTP